MHFLSLYLSLSLYIYIYIYIYIFKTAAEEHALKGCTASIAHNCDMSRSEKNT